MNLVIEVVVFLIGIAVLSIYPMTFLGMYGSLVFLSVAVLVIAKRRKISFSELGFTTNFKKTLSPWAIMTFGLLLLLAVAKFFYPDGVFTGLLKDRSGYIFFIPLYSFGAFLQEFVFRGYYFARVKPYMGIATATILNIIIFTLSHLPVVIHLRSNLIYLSVLGGVMWSIYYAKYPNIYLAGISHTLIGLATFLLLQKF